MLENWLKPLPASTKKEIAGLPKTSFGQSLVFFEKGSATVKGVKVALIGLDEKRANATRKALYPLDFPFPPETVIDLGNIRKISKDFIVPVIKELLDSSIFIILLGGDDQLMPAQYLGYQGKRKSVNVAIADQKIRFHLDSKENTCPLNEIIYKQSDHLFRLSIIGYQSHYTSNKILDEFDRHYFEYFRLGFVKQNMQEVEPVIRDADLFCFNLGSLKFAEAPYQQDPSPSGLLSEEACQICRYAGLSEKLTSMGFYGYDFDPKEKMTPQVIAQMIWYLLHGFFNRKNDYPVSNDGLVEYIVDYKELDFQISFWKSSKSGRWWMQVPVKKTKKHWRHRMVPCSYEDYLKASQEELPDRLMNAYKRFS